MARHVLIQPNLDAPPIERNELRVRYDCTLDDRPYRSITGTLANLLSSTRSQQRNREPECQWSIVARSGIVDRQAMIGVAMKPIDEVDARGDVAPLIRASDLHGAVVVLIEPQKVGRLQQLIRELGERETVLGAALDRVLAEELRHRKVLANLPKELEHSHLMEPINVVDDDRLRHVK